MTGTPAAKKVVTVSHLRARVASARRLAARDEADGNTLLALAREVVANEFCALADEIEAEEGTDCGDYVLRRVVPSLEP